MKLLLSTLWHLKYGQPGATSLRIMKSIWVSSCYFHWKNKIPNSYFLVNPICIFLISIHLRWIHTVIFSSHVAHHPCSYCRSEWLNKWILMVHSSLSVTLFQFVGFFPPAVLLHNLSNNEWDTLPSLKVQILHVITSLEKILFRIIESLIHLSSTDIFYITPFWKKNFSTRWKCLT